EVTQVSEFAMSFGHRRDLAEIDQPRLSRNLWPLSHRVSCNLRHWRGLGIVRLEGRTWQLNETIAVQEGCPVGGVVSPHEMHLLFRAIGHLLANMDNGSSRFNRELAS